MLTKQIQLLGFICSNSVIIGAIHFNNIGAIFNCRRESIYNCWQHNKTKKQDAWYTKIKVPYVEIILEIPKP